MDPTGNTANIETQGTSGYMGNTQGYQQYGNRVRLYYLRNRVDTRSKVEEEEEVVTIK